MSNDVKLRQVKHYTWKLNSGHKTCWNCKHINIGNMFHRMCQKHPEEHIWSGPDGNNEAFELKDSGKETETTVADDCPDYEFDSERKEKYGEEEAYETDYSEFEDE